MITQFLNRFNLNNALFQFGVFITLFALLACADAGDVAPRAFGGLILIMVLAILTSQFIQRYAPLMGFQTINLYISFVLVFLLIHPTQSYIWLVLACAVVVGQKYLLRPAIRLFNPTAFSLFTTYLVSKVAHSFGLSKPLLISWWGTDMNQSGFTSSEVLGVAIPSALLFGCIYFVLKFRKGLLAGTFFMTFMACVVLTDLSIHFSSTESLAFIMDSLFNSIAFLTCIMLCEPKTSPAFTKHQALIGMCGGLMLFMFTRTSWSSFVLADPLITTLLLVNIATYLFKKYGILK